MPAISADHARRFLVRRQLLDPPRTLPARGESVLAVVDRLGSLQFDPLEYPGARSHELCLHARIRNFRRELLDRWLYGAPEERRLFEAYNKSLNILPVAELPYHRAAWDRASARHQDGILAERAATVEAVLARLRDEGPLSTAAFKELSTAVPWHWAPTAEGRAVLEALFEVGRIGIARRDGSRRTFDLIERLFPAPLLQKRVSPDASRRHRWLSRYRGVGLMGARVAPELCYGIGDARERARLLDTLIDDGTLTEVTIEGLRDPRYALTEELPILRAAARPRRGERGVAFIAPLDPLLWDRRLVRDLFGFDYLWEVYTPERKRLHGYYVLPILFGERLVGRLEPRLDRRRKVLDVLGVWFERWFDPSSEPGFIEALSAALEDFRNFVGADRVAFGRRRVARALGQAIRTRSQR
jgi:hypothetical protein